MFDGISPSSVVNTVSVDALQRTRGAARVVFRHRDGRTRLSDLYQQGAMKLRFPRVPGSAAPEAVLLNTAGGLTAGDIVSLSATVGPSARATLTTQACEKTYRAVPGLPDAEVATSLTVGEGGMLEWLPQETILFDRARLRRRLEVDMAGDAELLVCEAVLLGRAAMGETVRTGAFRDQWRIRRDGRLIFADGTRLAGDFDRLGMGRATLRGARGFATLLAAGPGAEDLLDPARAALGPLTGPGLDGGVSAFGGLLVARLCAGDGMSLRHALLALLVALRPGRTPPKVWNI